MLLYTNIKKVLLRDIQRGIFPIGTCIPSESALIERFEVSRITVRRAIQELVSEGYLQTKQGKGVFVVSNGLEHGDAADEQPAGNVVLFLPQVTRGIFPEVTLEVERQLFARHLGLEICNTENDFERTQSYIGMLRRKQNILGIIYHPIHCELYDRQNGRVVDELERLKIPVLLLDGYLEGRVMDAVISDNEQAAFGVVQHLAGLGHQRIAIIIESGNPSLEERYQGFMRGMAEAGLVLDPFYIQNVAYYSENAYLEAARNLLGDPARRPTAIFASHDLIALSIYQAAAELGLTIGRDVSVVGFDDLSFARTLTPPLTTVRQSVAEMVAEIIRLLHVRLARQDEAFETRVIATEFVERASCAALHSGAPLGAGRAARKAR